MDIETKRYASSMAEMWDRCVRESRNGTVFHTRRFLAYHPADRFVDHSLLFLKHDRPVAVLMAAVKEEKNTKILVAHPGASYGGLVLSKDCMVSDTGKIVDALIVHAKQQGFAEIRFLRLPPVSIRQELSDDQEYWLYQRGAILERLEMDGSIDLRDWQESMILDCFTGKCRNMVRQAGRSGLTVRVSDDFKGFWPILEATLTSRHGTHPTHTLEEIERLKALLGDELRLFGAYDGSRLVGGIVVVTLHDTALYTLYIAQDYDHQKKHPAHCILTEIIRAAIAEGRSVLHLGVSTEDGGKTVNDGLMFFKESFGMRPVVRQSWVLQW